MQTREPLEVALAKQWNEQITDPDMKLMPREVGQYLDTLVEDGLLVREEEPFISTGEFFTYRFASTATLQDESILTLFWEAVVALYVQAKEPSPPVTLLSLIPPFFSAFRYLRKSSCIIESSLDWQVLLLVKAENALGKAPTLRDIIAAEFSDGERLYTQHEIIASLERLKAMPILLSQSTTMPLIEEEAGAYKALV